MPPNQPPPARRRPVSGPSEGPTPQRPTARPSLPSQRKVPPESKLICVAGPKQGTEFPLTGDEDIVIGRATENAVSIPDTSVSRRHAQLRRVPDGWAASDLGSGNGTLINGERINEETVLRNQDVITLGDTQLTYQDMGDTARRAPPVRRVSSPGSGPAPLARRSSLSGRPDVRARLSRAGAPIIDPDAQKKKKRLVIIGGAVGLVIVLGLLGLRIAKMGQEAKEEARQARINQQRAELSAFFQDAKNLIREGKWTEAAAKLKELKQAVPNYPAVDDYLDRATKEIPNEKNLTDAEAALQKGDVSGAAEALSKVSQDTQQYTRRDALQQAMDSKMVKLMTDAQAARAANDPDQVKALTDTILKVQPGNRDAKTMNDEATKTLEERSHPKVEPAGPAPKPWEAGILRFIDGDLTGALAMEDDCAAKKVNKCKLTASGMREFADTYKKLEDLDAHGLKKLLALDHEITEGRRSKLAKTAGIKLGTALCKSASAAKAAGQYARAGELASQASQADPGNNCATSILGDLKTKAHDLFMFAYSLKDQDPDQAVEKFKQVVQMTTPDSEDRLKAEKWIRELQK
jgi:pSer/pThr/pTyr-binding forkhead associated (FHA) protein/tetratricopeptide (TPR) repeat protein